MSEGLLARLGLTGPDHAEAGAALLAQAEQARLETVRVLFTDQHGLLRGKTVVASALPSILRNGLAAPSTLLLKDTSHRTVFPVWSGDPGIGGDLMRGASDVLMVPDPASLRILPWAPHSAWLLADVVFREGSPIPFAPRTVLARAEEALAAEGMAALMGLEVEFHVFDRLDSALDHARTTMPGAPVQTRALTQGFQFLTETRYAEAEGILDTLRRAAQAMGMGVRSVEIEMGPSQFEFTFDPAPPMMQAETMVLFRTLVKEVCAAKGLHASFMAKPRLENIAANGWHVHQSVTSADGNIFAGDTLGAQAQGWIAGLLAHAPALSLLMAPTVNSYKRYQPFQLAPNRIAWGRDNRGAMLRLLASPGDPASRVENRAPDSTANPYYAFAGQIAAGLDGIAQGLPLQPETLSPYDGTAPLLPTSLAAAIEAFEGSAMLRAAFGDTFVDYLARIKRAEWERYLATVSEWEQAEYFNLF
ncbi:MAG: glutamine synthetase [Pseudooceanicola sp.]|nr:glutamine synthetase [Pseudooceanicola sp.]